MRLIDADKAVPDIRFILDNLVGDSDWLQGYALGLSAAIDAICEAHTVDAVPVVHGRWVDKTTGRYRQSQTWCSACGKHSGIGGIESNRHKPYCPNCGADMRGATDE